MGAPFLSAIFQAHPPRHRRPRPRVLMVDDDGTVRMLTSAALEAAGFDVVEEGDGRAAVDVFARERPDLVLLDVHMGTANGFDVCRAIRAREDGQAVPIVILTSDTDEDTIQRAFDCGATDFEQKGVSLVALGKRLRFLHRAQRMLVALRESEIRLGAAQRLARIGSWEWDTASDVHVWSTEMYRLLGHEPVASPPTQTAFLSRLHPEDVRRVEAAMRDALASGAGYELECRAVLADGSVRTLHHRGEVVREGDRAVGLGGTVQDITVLRHAEERIRHLELYDALTGLPNRAVLLERTTAALEASRRNGTHVAVLVLDLDGFKRVNDTLGHHVGDRLLERVAERLRGVVRGSDTVTRLAASEDATLCRIGGDEFSIVLPEVTRDHDLARVAWRLVDSLRTAFDVDGDEIFITGSVGGAIFPKDGTDAITLLKHADSAMYSAKETARDGVRFFDPGLNARAAQRLSVESGLRHALARDELRLHFQPIVDADTSRVEGCECLVRWQPPGRGLVPPSEFIAIAEDSGLIVPLSEWVVRAACHQQAAWNRQGFRVPVSFNLSSRHFQTADVLGLLRSVTRESGTDPSQLTVEITESLLLRDGGKTQRILRGLKDLGIRIALDDFGTGYSALSYLRQFPVDRIKVDRSFVRGLEDSDDAVALVEAIALLSRRLGIEPLAEGVETERQRHVLRRIGYRSMQGFLFGHAVPAAEFAERLAGAAR